MRAIKRRLPARGAAIRSIASMQDELAYSDPTGNREQRRRAARKTKGERRREQRNKGGGKR